MKSDFETVGEFHRKFGLPRAGDGPPRTLAAEEFEFRMGFMLEELREYAEANGHRLEASFRKEIDPPAGTDLPKAADSLVDLAYVVLGTAHMHRLPWAALFAEVQRANMTKERCGIGHHYTGDGAEPCRRPENGGACGAPKTAHSLRGSALDVIKPKDWKTPAIIEVLMRAGWPGPQLPLAG